MSEQETRFWQGQWLRRLDTERGHTAVDEYGLVPFEAPEVPFTGVYLLGFFRDAGWEIGILDLGNLGPDPLVQQVNTLLASEPANVYLFSPYTTDYDFAKKILPHIRAHFPESVCVAGGHHVSARPLRHYLTASI